MQLLPSWKQKHPQTLKELFESAELEVVILSNDDIITGSGNDPISAGGDFSEGEGEGGGVNF